MFELENQISTWFINHLDLIKRGELISISQLAIELDSNRNETRQAIEHGISVNYERREQHVVFCGDEFCSLDIEEIVRTCLSRYLNEQGYTVIGKKGQELSFKDPTVLKKISKLCGERKEIIEEQLRPHLTSNGIDMLAYSHNDLTIIELKGVSLVKSDFNDTIFQMIDRYERFKNVLSVEEFSKVKFACAFPFFSPTLSKDHYKKQIGDLKNLCNTQDAKLLYAFASATNTTKSDGMKILQPFVDSTDNIISLIQKGKIFFYLVEGTKEVAKLPT